MPRQAPARTRKPASSDLFANAAVCRAGEFQFAAGQSHVNGCVQSRGLFWCKSGHGKFTVNGREYPLDPQDFYVLPWNRRIAYEARAREPMFTAHVHIVPWVRPGSPWTPNVPHEANEPLFNSVDRRDMPWPDLHGVVRLHVEAHSPLGRLMDYATNWFRYSFRAESEARALAILMLGELDRLLHTASLTDERRPQELTQMLVHLDRCLDDGPTVETLAGIIDRSRSHVLKLFQRHLGVSAKSYIIGRQIKAARDLLLTTNLPISEIGRRCGIPDPYHFSKMFRRNAGLSPKQFRSHGELAPTALKASQHSPIPARPKRAE